jgi:hypothetical protein
MENSSKRKRLRAPSPAMVVACIALAIALSGVGYAAIKIPNNSVGTAQLKNNAVSNAKLQGNSVGNGKLQGNSVNGAKVADGSLTGDDVADGSLSGSDVDQSSLDAVDAATLGGFGPDDFLQVPDTGYDSYVASGSAWVDRDGVGRNHVAITYDTTKTTLCTTTGASTGTEAAAYQDVHLPQGAKITTLFIDYRDDAGSTSSNGTITLVRQPLFSGSGTSTNATIFSTTLSDVAPAGSVFTAADTQVPPTTPEIGIVDNENYAYTLMANPGTLTGVAYCNAKITYELP